MMANRITRPEARVLAEDEFTRVAALVASSRRTSGRRPPIAPAGTSARWFCTSSVRAKRRHPFESSFTS